MSDYNPVKDLVARVQGREVVEFGTDHYKSWWIRLDDGCEIWVHSDGEAGCFYQPEVEVYEPRG